jgi:hypothetical protein
LWHSSSASEELVDAVFEAALGGNRLRTHPLDVADYILVDAILVDRGDRVTTDLGSWMAALSATWRRLIAFIEIPSEAAACSVDRR